jgi:hypothetical protein
LSKSVLLAGIVAAMIVGVGAAQAGTVTETFSGPVTISPTQAPGAWYTDRFAPAGFAASGGVLTETISAADHQGVQFYNTQGRKLDLLSNVVSISVDLYISSDFTSLDQRVAGLWGTAVDGADVISAYPVLELTSSGGNLEFQGYNTDVGGFTSLGSANAFIGTWQTLTITLDNTTDRFTYSAGGGTATAAGNGSLRIENAMLQGYNAGTSFSAQWDNFAQTTGAVPEPTTWAFMVMGFGGIGAALRRRQVRAAVA